MNPIDKLSFRPATQADIPTLRRLLAELFTLEADFTPDPEKQARGLAALIHRQDQEPAPCLVWLAVADGNLVGMCSLQVLFSTAEGGEVGLVEDVIIAADYRRQGIGQTMLAKLERWARDRGLRRLQLLADRENTAAGAFYRHSGWQATRLEAWHRHLTP